MVGTRQKSPESLVVRKTGRLARRLEPRTRPEGWRPPPAPAGLGRSARAAWRRFWESDASLAVDESADLVLLREWAMALDELERARAALRAEPFVVGPDGIPRPHPLAARARTLERYVLEIADRFGMHPLGRFRLQLTGAEAQRSVRALAREAAAATDIIDLEALDG
jgi:P27 family predicted phage terminase small subunit